MNHHTELQGKLGGYDNFQAWKYKVFLILKENDFDHYIINEFSEPEGGETKDTHNKNLVKEKRIIAGSIKDHLIPHASSFKTPK